MQWKIQTFMTEIKEDLNKRKDIPCSWISILNTVKITILSKLIYRVNTILIKISTVVFFCRNWEADLKVYMEIHETLNSQKNLEKEQNIGALTFSHFKTYYKATVNNKTVWYWHNDRHTVQQNKSAEGTETNLSNCGQLIFNRMQRQREKTLFNKRCWDNWMSTCKRVHLEPYLRPYKKLTLNGS